MASDLVPFTGNGSGIRKALIQAVGRLSAEQKLIYKLKPGSQALKELGDFVVQEGGSLRQEYDVTGGGLGTSVERAVITIITRVGENDINTAELISALKPLVPENSAVFGAQGITRFEPGEFTIEEDDTRGEVVTSTFVISIQATASF